MKLAELSGLPIAGVPEGLASGFNLDASSGVLISDSGNEAAWLVEKRGNLCEVAATRIDLSDTTPYVDVVDSGLLYGMNCKPAAELLRNGSWSQGSNVNFVSIWIVVPERFWEPGWDVSTVTDYNGVIFEASRGKIGINYQFSSDESFAFEDEFTLEVSSDSGESWGVSFELGEPD